MNREIKFRAWNPKGNMLAPFTIGDENTNIALIIGENWPLMQYTGLKDKNGKEIYEGDVLALEMSDRKDIYRFEVVYTPNGYCGFAKVDGKLHAITPPDFIEREVIGNIYSNPELLTP